jgi:hypothetical protein
MKKLSTDRHIDKIQKSCIDICNIVMNVLQDYKLSKYEQIKHLDYFFETCKYSVIQEIKNKKESQSRLFG